MTTQERLAFVYYKAEAQRKGLKLIELRRDANGIDLIVEKDGETKQSRINEKDLTLIDQNISNELSELAK